VKESDRFVVVAFGMSNAKINAKINAKTTTRALLAQTR